MQRVLVAHGGRGINPHALTIYMYINILMMMMIFYQVQFYVN